MQLEVTRSYRELQSVATTLGVEPAATAMPSSKSRRTTSILADEEHHGMIKTRLRETLMPRQRYGWS
jgi:hypothetical protein